MDSLYFSCVEIHMDRVRYNRFLIKLPKDGKILSAGLSPPPSGKPCVFILAPEMDFIGSDAEDVHFQVRTLWIFDHRQTNGGPIYLPKDARFVGTINHGTRTYHIFESSEK